MGTGTTGWNFATDEEAGQGLSGPAGDGARPHAGALPDGPSKPVEGLGEAGLLERVHGVFLGLPYRGEDQNAGDRFFRRGLLLLRHKNLVEPDSLLGVMMEVSV